MQSMTPAIIYYSLFLRHITTITEKHEYGHTCWNWNWTVKKLPCSFLCLCSWQRSLTSCYICTLRMQCAFSWALISSITCKTSHVCNIQFISDALICQGTNSPGERRAVTLRILPRQILWYGRGIFYRSLNYGWCHILLCYYLIFISYFFFGK